MNSPTVQRSVQTAVRGRNTLLVHAGGIASDSPAGVNPPVYRASTIRYPNVTAWYASRDPARRFDSLRYGQFGTTTTFALERAVATLEGGYRTILLPSGVAAVTATLQALLSSGDHALVVGTAYHPTRHFCQAVLSRFGVETTFYDPGIGPDIGALIRPETRVVFLESPGSLTFEVQDVPAIASVARQAGAIVVMDNTWATPYYFRAFEHGVDVSIQAATKYISGHSDVMLGCVTTTEAAYLPIRTYVADLGYGVSPDDAYLALRGLRTLGIRLERHQKSALMVAAWLQQRPEVDRVLYPALPGSGDHRLWKRDFLGASGLFTVVLRPLPRAALEAMLDSLELFGLGASFGGFESLAVPVVRPDGHMSRRMDPEVPCFRLHIGLEDPEDLIADLERGFRHAHRHAAAPD